MKAIADELSKIKILIADDVADERDLIKERLNNIFSDNFIEIIQSSEVEDAILKIETNDFDIVFSDMSFVGNKDDGGKEILISASKKSKKTRLFLFSHYRSKSTPIKAEEELKALKIDFSVIGKDPDDFSSSDFNRSVKYEFRKWTSFNCLRMNRDEVAKLRKVVEPSNFSRDEIITIGSENWRIKDLFFSINWENNSSIFSQINEFLIRYPIVDLEAWAEPNKGKFTLPIVDYYEELYFNPLFANSVDTQINPDSEKLLNIILRVFVYNFLDMNKDRLAALDDLRNSRLINGYTGKVPGKNNTTGELLPKAMPTFIYKLIGRQAALGSYLLLCLTPIEINNLLMYGIYSKESTDENDSYKQLISQSLFLNNFTDNRIDHIKYGLYSHIYNNASDDERIFLKSWWSKAPRFLEIDCGLAKSQIEKVLMISEKPFRYFKLQ